MIQIHHIAGGVYHNCAVFSALCKSGKQSMIPVFDAVHRHGRSITAVIITIPQILKINKLISVSVISSQFNLRRSRIRLFICSNRSAAVGVEQIASHIVHGCAHIRHQLNGGNRILGVLTNLFHRNSYHQLIVVQHILYSDINTCPGETISHRHTVGNIFIRKQFTVSACKHLSGTGVTLL